MGVEIALCQLLGGRCGLLQRAGNDPGDEQRQTQADHQGCNQYHDDRDTGGFVQAGAFVASDSRASFIQLDHFLQLSGHFIEMRLGFALEQCPRLSLQVLA